MVKRILVYNGSSVYLIFKETLQIIGWDLIEIQKVGTMNLVGFSGETSRVVGKVTLPVETHGLIIYSKMMDIYADSAYNVILNKTLAT